MNHTLRYVRADFKQYGYLTLGGGKLWVALSLLCIITVSAPTSVSTSMSTSVPSIERSLTLH
jgi:hypothetical protein